MSLSKLSLGTFLLLCVVGATGCGGGEGSSQTNDVDLTSESNTDVQVVSAKSSGTINWSESGSAYDAKKCKFSNRVPSNPGSQFTSTATADCTDAMASSRGAVINQYIERQAWIREDPKLSYAVFRNWCAEIEVVVAVKAAAWDAASFEGIGFYSHAGIINDDPNTRGVFYKKSDTRLKRIGAATLKKEGHQKVYLYKFAGAGPCTVNGTGDNPEGSVEFKPYMRYAGGHDRWESIPGNHGLTYRADWNRRGELLD